MVLNCYGEKSKQWKSAVQGDVSVYVEEYEDAVRRISNASMHDAMHEDGDMYSTKHQRRRSSLFVGAKSVELSNKEVAASASVEKGAKEESALNVNVNVVNPMVH